MEHEIWGSGFDGGLSRTILDRLIVRQDKKDSVFFYIPVHENEDVQQAQYDVLDGFPEGVTLEPVPPEHLHITLLFVEKMKDEQLEEFFHHLSYIVPKKFAVEVVHSGTFTEAEERPVILKLNPHPALIRLQNELYNIAFTMGLPISVHSKPEFYTPHISVAYNLEPQDTKIPDIKQPYKIEIDRFVASRWEYDDVRTVHLPSMELDDILVTRLGAGIQDDQYLDDEKDKHYQEIMDMEPAEPDIPKDIIIRYDPELEYEARQVKAKDFIGIDLGPPFWQITDMVARAAALCYQFGKILADELILGPGGAHEWTRADAMLQAPPEEQKEGFRYIFGQHSLLEAAAMGYASLIINGSQEMEERGYDDALHWYDMAMETYPDFHWQNVTNFHSLVREIGEEPPVPEYTVIIGRSQEEPAEPENGTEPDLEAHIGQFAVSRSDFMHMLRGGEITYGTLKRRISIQDGPFVVTDDDVEPHKIEPPEPVEFRPEPRPIRGAWQEFTDLEPYITAGKEDEKSLRERISNTLQTFVDRVADVFRGGPGSGHHGHAGRPGEVGGSLPSGASVHEETYRRDLRERLASIIETATRELKSGRLAEYDMASEISPADFLGGEVGDFMIAPTGQIFKVWDHDEAASEMFGRLPKDAKEELKMSADFLPAPKTIALQLGFIRGTSRWRPDTENSTLGFEAVSPISSDVRRTIRDIMAVFPEKTEIVMDVDTRTGFEHDKDTLEGLREIEAYLRRAFIQEGSPHDPDHIIMRLLAPEEPTDSDVKALTSHAVLTERAARSILREDMGVPDADALMKKLLPVATNSAGDPMYQTLDVIYAARDVLVGRGGPGSGYHDPHYGRPGKRGGSLPRQTGKVAQPYKAVKKGVYDFYQVEQIFPGRPVITQKEAREFFEEIGITDGMAQMVMSDNLETVTEGSYDSRKVSAHEAVYVAAEYFAMTKRGPIGRETKPLYRPPEGEQTIYGMTEREPDVISSLMDNEEEIIALDHEEARLFHPDTGELIFEKAGDVDMVAFSIKETLMMSDMLLMHNHPSGKPFSIEDVTFAIYANLSEMYAISDETGRHIIRMNTDMTPGERNMLREGLFDSYRDQKKETDELFLSKKLDDYGAWVHLMEGTLNRLENKHPNLFDYMVEESPLQK